MEVSIKLYGFELLTHIYFLHGGVHKLVVPQNGEFTMENPI